MNYREINIRRRQYLASLGTVGAFTLSGCNGHNNDRHPEYSTDVRPGDEGGSRSSQIDQEIGHYAREGQPGAVAPYVRIGQMDAYEATPSLVGIREMGTIERLVGYDDVTVASPTFESIATPFTYGYLESAPNRIPVLKVICVLRSATPGETLDVRVGTGALGVETPLMQFGTETDTEPHWQYDEVYLNEVGEGTAARKPTTLSEGAYHVWARVSGGEGTVRAASTLVIEWEII